MNISKLNASNDPCKIVISGADSVMYGLSGIILGIPTSPD